MIERLSIDEFSYDLPADRIAIHPSERRDDSKLLHFQKGKISHHPFQELPGLLPENAILFFNNTKVIPARLLFHKDTGATIEIFLLHPAEPTQWLDKAMSAKGYARWKCVIGNLKRWKNNILLISIINEIKVTALLLDRSSGIVEFQWTPDTLTFAEMISAIGKTPLPPYIHRETNEADRQRYQTVYAAHEGAVAAPTAGLHFTDKILDALVLKGVSTDYLTLHVSAGTFQPVTTENALDHPMHEEELMITRTNLTNLQAGKKVIAVGTTAMRVLESVYWYGNLLRDNADHPFLIDQYYPYRCSNPLGLQESLQLVAKKLAATGEDVLHGRTSIYIHQGYEFKVCDGLITNFHQPGSTLILLVAAFIGSDWRKVYAEAIEKDYRFLSYGDSSFLERS